MVSIYNAFQPILSLQIIGSQISQPDSAPRILESGRVDVFAEHDDKVQSVEKSCIADGTNAENDQCESP